MTERIEKASSLEEVGRSGLLISGGVVTEEFLPQLRGDRGRRILREMADNDPVIGGILVAFTHTIARLDWHFQVPDDASSDDQEVSDFTEECFEDMSQDWPSTVQSILSNMIYGWSYLEIVYKIRAGRDEKDGSRRSRYDDGKIGWRRWAERSQDSLLRWEIYPDGSLAGMTQTVYSTGTTMGVNAGNVPALYNISAAQARAAGDVLGQGGVFTVPIEKALLFRTTTSRGNPEGRSLLRNAYRPWFFKKRIEEIEAIGIERDLAGLPVAWLDPRYFSPSATADETALYNTVKQIVANIKRNEMEGVLFPLIYDDKGNKTIDLELMSSGGQRQFDTDKIIARYNQQIAMSVLADFLMLGHEQVGTQSLGVSKIDLWMMAVESVAKSIASVVNKYAVPRLLKLNGLDAENPPELVFGDVKQVDLQGLGTFLKSMCDAGIVVPDQTLEEYIRDLINLPPIDEETREEVGANIPLTPEEMAAYVAVGASPPATKPKPRPGEEEPGAVAKPTVKPGTKPEANAKAPAKAGATKPLPKAPAKPSARFPSPKPKK